jgi:hypothetical protein
MDGSREQLKEGNRGAGREERSKENGWAKGAIEGDQQRSSQGRGEQSYIGKAKKTIWELKNRGNSGPSEGKVKWRKEGEQLKSKGNRGSEKVIRSYLRAMIDSQQRSKGRGELRSNGTGGVRSFRLRKLKSNKTCRRAESWDADEQGSWN